MLKGEGLWFRYGTKLPWVVQDQAIAIMPGEIVGLMAPSGSAIPNSKFDGG
jgi:peptide/nickel transport system ATP-binding protein